MKLSLTTFIIQIINFVLLAYILHRVLYRPIRRIMEKRKRLVMEDIDRALRMKDDAIAIKERYERLTGEAEILRKKEMEKAVEQAEEAKKLIMDRAVRESEAEKEKARAVIENERTEKTASLRKDAVEISSELAARLLTPLADEALHKRLVELMVRELEERPPATPGYGKDGAKASVVSAYKLSDSEFRGIETILKDYGGPSLTIEWKVDPELIAGVRIWLDGLVLDGSLKGQLAAFRERALKAVD
jgi:F-type H+-transporting ATPase subunit b